jgi:DNA-directed RNA polymerase subunit K
MEAIYKENIWLEVEKMYTKYEKARIIGARALQIAMGAPALIKVENMFDPLVIAEEEFNKGVIPITVKRKVS